MKILIFQSLHDSNGLCEVNLRRLRAKIVYFEGAWVSPFMIQFTRIRHASMVLLIWSKWFIIKTKVVSTSSQYDLHLVFPVFLPRAKSVKLYVFSL